MHFFYLFIHDLKQYMYLARIICKSVTISNSLKIAALRVYIQATSCHASSSLKFRWPLKALHKLGMIGCEACRHQSISMSWIRTSAKGRKAATKAFV